MTFLISVPRDPIFSQGPPQIPQGPNAIQTPADFVLNAKPRKTPQQLFAEAYNPDLVLEEELFGNLEVQGNSEAPSFPFPKKPVTLPLLAGRNVVQIPANQVQIPANQVQIPANQVQIPANQVMTTPLEGENDDDEEEFVMRPLVLSHIEAESLIKSGELGNKGLRQTNEEEGYSYYYPVVVVDTRTNQVTAFFANQRRQPYYEKVSRKLPEVISIGNAGVNIVKSRAVHGFLQVFTRRPKDESSKSWLEHPKLLKAVGFARLGAGLIGGAVAVYTIIEQALELRDEFYRNRKVEKIDAVLGIVIGIADLLDSISVSAAGLEMIKAVEASQVLWATPLAIVAASMSVFSIALHARKIVQCKEIENKLEEASYHLQRLGDNDCPIADIDALGEISQKEQEEQLEDKIDNKAVAVLEWLKNSITDRNGDGPFWLQKNFGILNRESYALKIKHIIDNGSRTQKKKMVDSLLNCIRKRKTAHKLAILSAIVSVIGVFLIFFAASLGAAVVPVGLAIIGLSGCIAFARWRINKKAGEKLENQLKDLTRPEYRKLIPRNDEDFDVEEQAYRRLIPRKGEEFDVEELDEEQLKALSCGILHAKEALKEYGIAEEFGVISSDYATEHAPYVRNQKQADQAERRLHAIPENLNDAIMV